MTRYVCGYCDEANNGVCEVCGPCDGHEWRVDASAYDTRPGTARDENGNVVDVVSCPKCYMVKIG